MSRSSDVVSCCTRKRKRSGGGGGERVFRFKSFGQKGYPIEFDGSFRENVEALVEVGNAESVLCSNINGVGTMMRSWSFQLEVNRHPPSHLFLFVLEELIEKLVDRHCKYCQYTGWGHHLVCNKKYHFVLPSKNTMSAFLDCIDHHHLMTSTNKINNNYNSCKGKLINVMELQDHIMHGVFHSNGFGHLLCLNGLEAVAGSNLSGRQIMNFWDHLCNALRARKVSLNDISTKRGMELRLMHGIAYKAPWFGSWGYKFSRGSYGVIQPMYEKAIDTLRAMPLCILVHYLGSSNHDIPIIFSRYQMLSDHSLTTLGDMFQFMLELKTRMAEENLLDSYTGPGMFVEQSCRWSPKRIEMATRAIVEALKRADFRWVSRQEVRDAARIYIGDTGLLDFVLKSLGNHMVGNYLVRRCLNPVTKVLEYCLEDVSNIVPTQDPKVKTTIHQYRMSKSQLMKDMLYLYKHILKDYPSSLVKQQSNVSNNNTNKVNVGILSVVPTAVRIILDAKYFAKEYHEDQHQARVEIGSEDKLSVYCTIMLRNNNINIEGTTTTLPPLLPPFECVRLRRSATFNELMVEVEKIFRDLYWGMKNLILDSVANLEANGKDLVFGQVEVGGKVIFQGSNKGGIGFMNHHQNEEMMYYEGGSNWNKVVVCGCGAREDDGERMVSCDICEVWQHTKCVGIPHHQPTPQIFLCKRCENEIVTLPAFP
ncbi:unnamed protein product [Linum tenue]|uniref:PHD-type domain-containing protein n=1 Tax=Linum tenue TaxID=586396 RepID=A0AAV0NL88_9ROSI|nr:unnamed protein product [Linum tenue]